MDSLDKELYGEELKKIYGPYFRADGRAHLVLSYGFQYGTRTLSYSKYLLERKLGRILVEPETTDHIDGDKTNNRIANLQVLNRVDNIQKSSPVPLKNCLVCNKQFKPVVQSQALCSARCRIETRTKRTLD